MTEKELGLRIQTAINSVTPDAFAQERIFAKISAEKVPEKRARKRIAIYAVPLCLVAVIFGAGIGFLRNGDFSTSKHTEETGKPEYCTEVTVAMTAPASLAATYAQTTVPEGGMIATSTVPMSGRLEAYLPSMEDDFVTVSGKQYLLSWGTESTGEIVGVVESATQAEMLGLAVYATEIDGVVAIRTDAQWLNYRYVGKADGTATMVDWLTEYGIAADSLAEI
ncbi:MAG: hypothetical protein IKU55_04510, partial [Clostridia bacterium]|nr:hypothetical protein [Clostridia bacterium]